MEVNNSAQPANLQELTLESGVCYWWNFGLNKAIAISFSSVSFCPSFSAHANEQLGAPLGGRSNNTVDQCDPG
jgi:hypothetical protein